MFIAFTMLLLVTFILQSMPVSANQEKQNGHRGVVVNGMNVDEIRYPASASDTVKFAASELSRYLSAMTSTSYQLKSGEFHAGCMYIASSRDIKKSINFRRGRYDRSIIFVQNNSLCFTGENDRSVLYAVCDFLQHHLGIGFYGPDDNHECIPHFERIDIPAALNLKYSSDMEFRDYHLPPVTFSTVDFLAKNRINMITGFADIGAGQTPMPPYAAEIRKRGLMIRGPLHDWSQFMLDAKLFETHPEYFPVINGKRTVNGRTACFSNPKAVDIFMTNWREFIRKKRGAWDVITFWPEDIPDEHYCGCAECTKEPNSNWYMMLVAKAAKIVEEEAPEAVFEFIAYHTLRTPPTKKVALPSNGSKMLMNLCVGYDRNLYMPLFGDDQNNRRIIDMIAQWQSYLASIGYRGRTMIMDYYNLCEMPGMGPRTHAFLWPVDVMQKDCQHYLKRNITGVGDWVLYNKLCFPTPFMMWSWLQMWSDTRCQLGKLEDKFYSSYFGSVGRRIQAYIKRLTSLMHVLVADEYTKNLAEVTQLVKSLESLPVESLSEVQRHRVEVVKVHGVYCIMLKQAYQAVTKGTKEESDAYRKQFADFFTKTYRELLQPDIDIPPFGTEYWWECIERYEGFKNAMISDRRLH